MFQNYFNIKRFCKALKYDLKINAKKYLFFVVSLVVVLVILDLFFILNSNNTFREDEYLALFYLTYIFGLVIVVGTSFPLLRDKKSTINYLMIPASLFEKILIQFVIRVLCFMILFVPIFWLDFKLADGIYNLYEWKRHLNIDSFELFYPFKVGYLEALDLIAIICALFSLAAFLFAGATHFKKQVLPKTIFSFALFAGFVFVLFVVATATFYPEKFSLKNQPIFLNDYRVFKESFKRLVNIQLFFYVIGIVSSLFLLPLAYFKLKEKEL